MSVVTECNLLVGAMDAGAAVLACLPWGAGVLAPALRTANPQRNPFAFPPLPLISADRPAPDYSRLARPTSRCQRLSHVQVAAEAEEILGPLEEPFPTAKT